MAKHQLLVAALVLGAPTAASAAIYNLHLGGMCSQGWTDGKGSSQMGSWSSETAINVAIDQRDSVSNAAWRLKSYLDYYCVGSNTCYIYNYSAGDAVLNYLYANTTSNWNIGYAITTGGAGGGSRLAGDIAGALTCSLANNLTHSSVRGLYNHNDTNGETVYRLGGHKSMWESTVACVAGTTLSVLTLGLVSSHCMTESKDDGAVAYHSSGAYTTAGDFSDFWNSGSHWGSGYHKSYWSPSTSYDEGEDLNHYEIKGLGICLDGGISGVSGYSACMSWANNSH